MQCQSLPFFRMGVVSLALIGLLFMFGSNTGYAAAKTVVRVKGCHALADMVQRMAKSFEKGNSDCSIIVSGGGTERGIKDFLGKSVEIVMSERKLSAAETKNAKSRGIDPTARIIGSDGLAVIVHPQNPLMSLTIERLASIFKGKYKSWKDVGGPDTPITVILMSGENDALTFFQNRYLRSEPFAEHAVKRKRWNQVISRVAAMRSGIALCAAFKALKARAMVKTLSLAPSDVDEPVPFSQQTLSDGSYPITLPLYLITDAKGSRCAKQFHDYCIERGTSLHSR